MELQELKMAALRAMLRSLVCTGLIAGLAVCGDKVNDLPGSLPSLEPTAVPTQEPPESLRSDFNDDNCVGYADYELLLDNYGLELDASRRQYDLNEDEVIDFLDYEIVLQDWGAGCSAPSGVAEAQQFNFMAEITDENHNHLCSAVIVESTWAMSLAACTQSLELNTLRILSSRLNSRDKNINQSDVRSIEQVMYYPEVAEERDISDLVLIKVSEAFTFGEDIAPIAVSNTALAESDNLQMLGWGIVSGTVDTTSSLLQYIDVAFDSGDTCKPLTPTDPVPSTCVKANNDSLRFENVDLGAAVIRIESSIGGHSGLHFQLSGFVAAADEPVSSASVVAGLATNDARITNWVESTLARVNVYGDIDGDACVGELDYQLYLANNGRTREESVPPEADINSDGIVNYFDYALLLQQWGQGCAE